MSLYKDASLVMIPSAYKDGKLYSIRPTDGDGDFTFSRGSNLAATRVDVNGLIEKGRENVLLQSNNFNTSWTKTGYTLTSGQADRNGGTDAWLANCTATGNALYQSNSSSGVLTFSIYAKEGTQRYIRVRADRASNDPETRIDLNDGSIDQQSNVIDVNVTDAGNDYYRIEMTFLGTSLSNVQVRPVSSTGGDVAGTIYIQDAQLEAGLVATDYIETTSSTAQAGILEDMPRLDYSGGASCPALLLEPQRTNLVSQSEFYGGSDWSRTRCGFVTNTSETLSPEGLYNASKMTSNAIQESYAQNDVVLGSTSGTYTFFAKKGDLDYCHALVWDRGASGRRQWFNLATGAVGTTTNFGSGYTKVDATIEDYGNGWYRCSFSWSGGNTTSGVRINISSGDGVIGSPINSYGYFYGAQVEAGVSYPTSYIPTYGASVTRTHDRGKLTGSNFTDVFSGNGTIYTNLENRTNTSSIGYWSRLSSTGVYNDMIKVEFSGSNQKLQVEMRTNNVTQFYYQSPTASIGFHKVAVSYNNGDVVIYMDGVKLATYEDRTMPDLDEIYIAGYVDSSIRGGTKKDFVIFPTALTDSECIALTTL